MVVPSLRTSVSSSKVWFPIRGSRTVQIYQYIMPNKMLEINNQSQRSEPWEILDLHPNANNCIRRIEKVDIALPVRRRKERCSEQGNTCSNP